MYTIGFCLNLTVGWNKIWHPRRFVSFTCFQCGQIQPHWSEWVALELGFWRSWHWWESLLVRNDEIGNDHQDKRSYCPKRCAFSTKSMPEYLRSPFESPQSSNFESQSSTIEFQFATSSFFSHFFSQWSFIFRILPHYS